MPIDSGNQITIWSVFSLLMGTIVSSIVAYLLQRNSFAEARRLKAQDKLDERKALGLTLFHKMLRIASTLSILKLHMDEGLALAKAQNITGEPWQVISPIASFPDRVKFTPEELTFLMLLDKSLFSDMGPFDDIHNTLLESFQLYNAKRDALTDTLEPVMRGNVGGIILTPTLLQKIAPKTAELNVLIQGMLDRSTQDSNEARELLERLRNFLNKEFGLQLKIEIKPRFEPLSNTNP
jgi:hypothetical protein